MIVNILKFIFTDTGVFWHSVFWYYVNCITVALCWVNFVSGEGLIYLIFMIVFCLFIYKDLERIDRDYDNMI